MSISCKPSRMHRLRGWPGLRLRLDATLGEQLLIERIARFAAGVPDIAVADIRVDVIRRVVTPVPRHRRLDRMLNPRQPLFQRARHLALGLGDDLPALIFGDGIPAGFPSLPLGLEPAAVRLAALVSQRIGLDIEQVRPGLPPPVDVTFHAASSSSATNARNLAETTYTRRPSRLTGRSPELAKR